MALLVLHAGAEFADGGAVHRDLVAWREPLQAAGVWIPPGDDPAEWRESAQGLLRRKLTAPAADLVSQAQQAGTEVVLISSEALADALTSPDQVTALAEMGRDAGLEVRVVVVVREQIGYINDLYCRRVLALETARSFAEFATTSVPAHRFDYVASFGAIADTEGVDLVAIPYPQVLSAGAGRSVLGAAGVSAELTATLPGPAAVPTPVPGPVVVGAARLLHKRMRRNGMFNEFGKPGLRLALNRLIARADEAGWDTTQFWGWDAGLRRRAEEEHGPTNDLFAEFVWGTPWPEPWSTDKVNRVDFADLEPTLLEDVFGSIDGVLETLTKQSVPTEPDYEEHEIVVLDDDDDS